MEEDNLKEFETEGCKRMDIEDDLIFNS